MKDNMFLIKAAVCAALLLLLCTIVYIWNDDQNTTTKTQTERKTTAIADEKTILTFDLEDTGKKVNMNKPGRFGFETTKIKVYYDKKTCLVYIGSIYDDLPIPLMKDKNTQYVWNKTKKSLE